MTALAKPTNATNADYANRIGLLFDAFNNGNYQFPATAVPSADPNTLDDYEEGTYTPTVTAGSGTFTTVSATGKYTKIGNAWFTRILITITTNGTAATSVTASLPATASERCSVYGRENGSSGKALAGEVQSGNSNASIVNYDNTYPGGSGVTLAVTMLLF
jgi:hypothetical protein